MNKQVTFLMCSPRGEKSASYAVGTHLTKMCEEQGLTVDSFHIYKTLKKPESIEKMISSIDKSEIIVLSSPLYIDCAPYMTIKLMNIITERVEKGQIAEKKRLLFVFSNAGFLEYYHNNIALQTYQLFAEKNGFTWAGGIPIGAAGTYVEQSIDYLGQGAESLPEEDPRRIFYCEPAKILHGVIKEAVKRLIKGEQVPEEELEKVRKVYMPLQAYVEGGNKSWIQWAEKLGTVEKLRDKPYEK